LIKIQLLQLRICCGAGRHDFEQTLQKQYGLNESMARGASAAYIRLESPVPSCGCGPPDPHTPPPHWRQAGVRAAGHYAFACPTRFAARQWASSSRTIYFYQFAQTPAFSYNVDPHGLQCQGAFHGADVPFSWLDHWELKSPQDERLGEIMSCYIRQFIETGNPNAGSCNLPQWPPFHLDNDVALKFSGNGIELMQRPYAEQCGFLRPFGKLEQRLVI